MEILPVESAEGALSFVEVLKIVNSIKAVSSMAEINSLEATINTQKAVFQQFTNFGVRTKKDLARENKQLKLQQNKSKTEQENAQKVSAEKKSQHGGPVDEEEVAEHSRHQGVQP